VPPQLATDQNTRSGPLAGLRIVEFAGLGPGPFCGMLLSDAGADVIRIDRPGVRAGAHDVTQRGRRSIALDLKQPAAIEACLTLLETADATFEGFRPGVMERLGLGPDAALARNPKLVYGRMTGWGQTGPLAPRAGHDINYIALSGALHAIGTPERPIPPLNLVGDYGGGAMFLAFGLLAAIFHARETGRGQVIDAAMTDGAASLMSMFYGFHGAGQWRDVRRSNFLDGGVPFYDVYECADGRWLSLGPLEPQFFAALCEALNLGAMPQDSGPALREAIAAAIARETRDHWEVKLCALDVCAAPVLSLDEAPRHPHNRARETFVERDGVTQPAPAPRFSATPGHIQGPPPNAGDHNDQALRDWGFPAEAIQALRDQKALIDPA
jgi:alpha-methylacyl-CoA racemase